MAFFDTTRVIGWLSLFLLAVVIALPYVSTAGTAPRRMTFHYWLAPLVPLGSFVHAWIPMASHHMPRTNYTGLWIATVALGLMLLQIGMGWALRNAGRSTAKLLRRTHFALMLGITALVLVHLWMNSQLLRSGG